MAIKLLKIKILVWIALLSLFSWWGIKSVIRYWNQPLTTNIVYRFGDNENGIQFPLITFCEADFIRKNKILQDCTEKDSLYFIELLTDCLKNNKTFKMSSFMKSLKNERRDIIKVTEFWDGYKITELDHLSHQIWSKVFNPGNGLCFMFDVSSIDKLKYIPYNGLGTPDFGFLFADNVPWKKIRIYLHTKYDLPDAYQLNGRLHIGIEKYQFKISPLDGTYKKDS